MNRMKQMFTSKGFTIFAAFLGLYLLSAGTSWAIFSYLRGEPGLNLNGNISDNRAQIDSSLPKTEECPINGKMYTEPERVIWENKRPIAAMVENHEDSRPPSGLSRADVIYEAVAEGGITRFLNIFYCGAAASDVRIAPVRSARVYYINWAAEYGENPIFMHVGGANDYSGYGDTVPAARALELLETLGWRVPGGNDLDTTYDSGFPIFWRNYERLDKEVATEHTMMASLDAAYKEAEDRGFGATDSSGNEWTKDFVNWLFADDNPLSSPKADKISFEFWSNKPNYDVDWEYEKSSNSYLRYNGGQKHVDLETGEQLSAKNIVVQFIKEQGPVDRNKHMLYTTIGSGDALIFQNGDVIKGTWEKDARQDRTTYFNSKGDEVKFVRGTIWIEAVPLGNDIDY